MAAVGLAPWWAVEIYCHSALKKAALWRLRGPGHRAYAVKCEDEHVTIWAFLTAGDLESPELTRLWLGLRLDAAARQQPNPTITWQQVGNWDWPEPIRELIVPREVGRRLTIVPSGTTNVDSERLAIHLDGRFGFGVGGVHSTTRLCLEALERRFDSETKNPPKCLADIGCGAGDQGIAAILLGAERVYAVDTKAASVYGTTINREFNGIEPERLLVEQGSVSDLAAMLTAPVDGFVCNILTRIIMHLIPKFEDISGQHTWGILSGIRETELAYVERPLEFNGWNITRISRLDGWCCVEVSRAEFTSTRLRCGSAS